MSDIDNLKSFRKDSRNSINRGKQSYIDVARDAVVSPVDSILVMRSRLTSQGDEPEEFFNDLGNNDSASRLEARTPVRLHPMV